MEQKKTVAWGGAIIIFIIGLPSMLSQGAIGWLSNFLHYEGTNKAFFDVVFDVFSDTGLPLGGLLMMIFITRKWGINKFDEENVSGNPGFAKSMTRKFLHLSIVWVCPILLGLIFVVTIVQKFLGIQVF